MNKYRKDWYSQNGEDGVLQELANRLGIVNGFAVEFGAWDGIYASNTYHLISEKGWRGLHIEADEEKYSDLLKNPMVVDGRITPEHRLIVRSGSNSLDEILTEHGVDQDFDLLSIDIDSIDYYIWESLRLFQPKIVVVEINSSTAPHIRRISTNGYVERNYANMIELGKTKGYTAVCHTGNIIFVRNDLINSLSIPTANLNPDRVFNDRFFKRIRVPRNRYLRRFARAILKLSRLTVDPYQRVIGQNPYDLHWDQQIDKLYGIKFESPDANSSIVVSSSRPELLPACLAIAVHPDDPRYSGIAGHEFVTPIFNKTVQVIATVAANPNYHSGAMMISSFADPEDVGFVRDLGLSARLVISKDGTMNALAGVYEGRNAADARLAIAQELENEQRIAFRIPLEPTTTLSPQHES